MKRRKLLMLLIAGIVIITNSCSNGIVEPEPQPGRRDYVWDITEIKPGYESLYLLRIWGSSPNDVWSIGTSSSARTSIWHFNGNQWRCDSVYRAIQPTAITGFSSNEIWLGNINNTIWKYDGNEWKKYGEYLVPGFNETCINNFASNSSNDIYAVGYVELLNANTWKAIIMHYDGNGWSFLNIPEIKLSLETIAIDRNGVLVMSGTVYDPSGFVAKVYYWDGSELRELLSEQGRSFVTKLGDDVFATMNSKIYKYNNKQLVLWKDNTGTGINRNIICGRNRNDFFIGSSEGIAHYNGTDFSVIYKSEAGHNIAIERGCAFENDVFFVENDFTTGKNLIIHGKLK